jgi:MauM/NapG family ferredoxin protein
MSSDSPMDRRRFFRLGFRELLKPLAEAAQPVERALRELESLSAADDPPKPPPVPTTWLRPPGALEERRFRDVCSRCGTCVSVCPATAIKLDTSGVKGNGVPYIIPSDMPCVACDGLYCMKNCPSGALVDTPLFDIDMGTAIWHEHLCVRSQGQECMICVEKCPLGSAAIELREGKIHVIEEGCIGCGVCEHDCPTSPKSITIRPKGAAGAVSRT